MDEEHGLLRGELCMLCKEPKHLERINLPCNCSITTHPDCFATYTLQNRRRVNGKWKLQCTQCLKIFTAPEHTAIQITIPKDDDWEDLRPMTRREMRCEQWKIGTAISAQCLFIFGVMGVCGWLYANLPNGYR